MHQTTRSQTEGIDLLQRGSKIRFSRFLVETLIPFLVPKILDTVRMENVVEGVR